MYGKIFNEFRPYSIYYYLFNIDKTSGLKVITKNCINYIVKILSTTN